MTVSTACVSVPGTLGGQKGHWLLCDRVTDASELWVLEIKPGSSGRAASALNP